MTVCDQCMQLFDGLADCCPECERENEKLDWSDDELEHPAGGDE